MIFLCYWFLWFMFYNVVGWVYEMIVCTIQERKRVKRGFLWGPYCPIYGAGALLDMLLLGWIQNPVILFFAGMMINCSLEYFTGWALEKMFHAKWWDYTGWFLNIKGRVCFLGALAFGTMSVLLVKFIHPFVTHTTSKIPILWVMVAAGILLGVFVFDLVMTIIHLNIFNEKLKQAQNRINELASGLISLSEEKTAPIKSGEPGWAEQIKGTYGRITWQERSILRSFPKFQSTRYGELVERLKEVLKQ